MTQDLITINTKNISAVFTTSGIDAVIKEVEEKVLTVVQDVSSEQGRDEIKAFGRSLTRSKNKLDDLGKDHVSVIKAQSKVIDVERKRMRDFIDAAKEKVIAPLVEYENVRKDIDQQKINLLAKLTPIAEVTAIELSSQLKEVSEIDIDSIVEDKRDGFKEVVEKVKSGLFDMLEAREKYEAEQRELAEFRAAQEAQDEKNEEEAIRKEAEKKASRQAEQRINDAEEKAAIAEQAAVDQAESSRLEQERRDKQAESDKAKALQDAEKERERILAAENEVIAKRGQDSKNRHEKKTEAANSLCKNAGLTADIAKDVVRAIASGAIDNIKIVY